MGFFAGLMNHGLCNKLTYKPSPPWGGLQGGMASVATSWLWVS